MHENAISGLTTYTHTHTHAFNHSQREVLTAASNTKHQTHRTAIAKSSTYSLIRLR